MSSVLLKWYGTNQPQLKRDTQAKRKKMRVILMHTQKSNFACACVCNLNHKGCHTRNACTTTCDRGQNALTDLDRKILLLHCIGIMILVFSSEIFLTLTNFAEHIKEI